VVNELNSQASAISKDELTALLNEAVSKEIEGMKAKIVKEVLKKTQPKKPKEVKEVKEAKSEKPKKEKEPKKEVKEEKLVKEVKAIHGRVTCDGCQVFPIEGTRYKCSICHDFDYCEKCEESNSKTHLHPFLKIRQPEQAPIEIFCTINDAKTFENKKPEGRGGRCGGAFKPIKKMFKDMFTSKFENQEDFNKEFNEKLQNFQDFFTEIGNKCGEYGNKCGEYVNKEKGNVWEQVKDNMGKFFQLFTNKQGSEDILNTQATENINAHVEQVSVQKTEETAQPSEIKKDDIIICNINTKVEPVIEPIIVEVKKEEVKPEIVISDYHRIVLKQIKADYDLRGYSDDQLLSAIAKAKGVPEDVFLFLFTD